MKALVELCASIKLFMILEENQPLLKLIADNMIVLKLSNTIGTKKDLYLQALLKLILDHTKKPFHLL
jgi:hypothetical protein